MNGKKSTAIEDKSDQSYSLADLVEDISVS